MRKYRQAHPNPDPRVEAAVFCLCLLALLVLFCAAPIDPNLM